MFYIIQVILPIRLQLPSISSLSIFKILVSLLSIRFTKEHYKIKEILFVFDYPFELYNSRNY